MAPPWETSRDGRQYRTYLQGMVRAGDLAETRAAGLRARRRGWLGLLMARNPGNRAGPAARADHMAESTSHGREHRQELMAEILDESGLLFLP